MDSSGSMPGLSAPASRPPENHSPQRRGWSCEAKVGMAVAAVFVLLGAAALIIPNFVAVSSLPMPMANLRIIGVLVASGGLVLGLIVGFTHGHTETRDDGVSKRSSEKSDAEIGDLDTPARAEQSSSEDEISEDEGGTSSESGEYMHIPPSAEPKDRGVQSSPSGKTLFMAGSLIDVPPNFTSSVPDGGFEFESGETNDPAASRTVSTRELTDLTPFEGEIDDVIPGVTEGEGATSSTPSAAGPEEY